MRSAVRLGLAGAMTLMLTVAATAEKPSSDQKKQKRDPNEVVCENVGVLGSRLAVKRVCMTRAQWAEQRRSDRELVDRSQLNGCMRNSGC